jgi:hypothetical protein
LHKKAVIRGGAPIASVRPVPDDPLLERPQRTALQQPPEFLNQISLAIAGTESLLRKEITRSRHLRTRSANRI